MLKRIRRVVAAVFFILLTLLFLDFTGTIHLWFGWLAKIQLIPAILAVNGVVIAFLLLFTLLFGRLYCSIICPLGVMQDGISFFSRRISKKKRFRYLKAKSWLRYILLVLFVVTLVAGIVPVFTVLEPYSAYGRIASTIFAPLYQLGNNLLAWFAEKADSYAFYSADIWMKGWITLAVSIATLFVVGVLSWRNGRTYCNTICPVGTFLGLISRFSIFKPTFDVDKCTKCGVCERNCKSSCIDSKQMTIDQSRCVTCFNCIDKCKFGAMKYAPATFGKKSSQPADVEALESEDETTAPVGKKEGVSRAEFLSIAGLFAFTHTVKAQQLKVDGGLADIEDKKRPDRNTPIAPPGAESLRNMNVHCTACQLCVSACPNQVLRPSEKLSNLMQPEMTYERGYCRPECTECSQVCPNGAIKKITVDKKSAIAIGQAVWIKENCIVNTDEVQCTSCQQHCPAGAILLVNRDPDKEKSLKIPVIDKEICIGCGACEYLCPARPFSAIYVEGYVKHHSI